MVDPVNECSSNGEIITEDSIRIPRLCTFFPLLSDSYYKNSKMIWDSEKQITSVAAGNSSSSTEEDEEEPSADHRTKKNSKKMSSSDYGKKGRRLSSAADFSSDSDEEYERLQRLQTAVKVEELYCTEVIPRNVRWFYRLSESKKWVPFTGYDSLRIELKYRHVQAKTDEDWQEVLALVNEKELAELNMTEEKVVVQGGLYEVDTNFSSCTAIFWTGDSFSILRGVWFYESSYQPLDEPFSSEIEKEHLKKFKNYKAPVEEPSTSSPRKSVTQALHVIRFPEFHVEWYAPDQLYLYSEAKSSKIMRTVTERFGFPKSGYKLSRGYKIAATLEEKSPDITHLVFVIHGVGQKSDSRRIIRNCGSLRNCANWLKEKYFSYLVKQNERSEFFPVEWRSSLKLDGDTVDSITLHRVRGLRDFLNSNAMDIMYYTSPLYRTELINGLETELCRLYQLFCQRNPNFEKRKGKVSIVAHSLGCVITYDLITGWNPLRAHDSKVENFTSDQLGISDEKARLMEQLKAAKGQVSDLEKQLHQLNLQESLFGMNRLPFTIENLFCLGSPLAVFLALRGVRPGHTGLIKEIIPTNVVKRFFNICHPSDPVAYRLEPLVLKHYSGYMPLVIHFYYINDKIPYEEMKPELMPYDNQDKRPQSPIGEECDSSNDSSKSTKGESRWSMVWPTWARRREPLAPDAKRSKPNEPEEEPGSVSEPYLSSDGEEVSLNIKSTPKSVASQNVASSSPGPSSLASPIQQAEPTMEYRLDYMLREGNLENSYISAFTSHTSYWTSYDAAAFILSYLHSSEEKSS